MFDVLKRSVYASIGLANVTREKAPLRTMSTVLLFEPTLATC